MHGVERGKIWRLLQRIAYRYLELMLIVNKEADNKTTGRRPRYSEI